MGFTVKHFDLNKLTDLLRYIGDDIDEDDMKNLKEHIKKFKDEIKTLKNFKKDKKVALRNLQSEIDTMLGDTDNILIDTDGKSEYQEELKEKYPLTWIHQQLVEISKVK